MCCSLEVPTAAASCGWELGFTGHAATRGLYLQETFRAALPGPSVPGCCPLGHCCTAKKGSTGAPFQEVQQSPGTQMVCGTGTSSPCSGMEEGDSWCRRWCS